LRHRIIRPSLANVRRVRSNGIIRCDRALALPLSGRRFDGSLELLELCHDGFASAVVFGWTDAVVRPVHRDASIRATGPGHGRRHRPKITKDKPSFALWVAIGAQSEFE